MTDTEPGPRPQWPGPGAPQSAAVPAWVERVPDPNAVVSSDVAPAAAPKWPRRRITDVKLVIAVLIGVVSVTGAAITWQASVLSERATDHDRLSIAETVQQQQLTAEAELLFANEKARAAEYLADLAAADSLDAQADAASDADVAEGLRLQADTLRAEADRLTSTGAAPVSFIEYLDEEAGVLDEDQLRDDLRTIQSGHRALDPERNAAEARRLREDGLRLVSYLLPLVAAIVVLTLAEISRRPRLRLALVGVSTTVWIVVTGLAVAA
jgi:hypothetical protein